MGNSVTNYTRRQQPSLYLDFASGTYLQRESTILEALVAGAATEAEPINSGGNAASLAFSLTDQDTLYLDFAGDSYSTGYQITMAGKSNAVESFYV